MSIAGSHRNCCRDYKPSSRQSRGSERRGRYVNPASSTANVQGRKAQTDVPVREKVRSQPGREDHQAHRNSKDQAEREELSLTRSLREGTASAPAAPGCQENRPSEAEATPEGEGSKPKRQSADRGQSRLGEPGSRLRPGVHKG